MCHKYVEEYNLRPFSGNGCEDKEKTKKFYDMYCYI